MRKPQRGDTCIGQTRLPALLRWSAECVWTFNWGRSIRCEPSQLAAPQSDPGKAPGALTSAPRATSPERVGSQFFGNSKHTVRRPHEMGDRRPQKLVTHVTHVTGLKSQWFSPFSAVTGLVTGRHRSSQVSRRAGPLQGQVSSRRPASPQWERPGRRMRMRQRPNKPELVVAYEFFAIDCRAALARAAATRPSTSRPISESCSLRSP
jgi:hypothetical protein